MTTRRVRHLVLAAGVCWPGIGCLSKQHNGDWTISNPLPPTTTAAPGTPSTVADDLPNKEQAALCLTMAESFDRDGKDADAALYYEQARTLDPGLNERVAHRLAILYDKLDQQAKAMVEFQELVKKRPKDAALLNDMGYSLYNRGQWIEAESYLRRSVAADKTNKRAWVNLGLALSQQGKYQEGLEAFQKAVSPAEAQANLGFVLVVQGRSDEAIAAYRRALELEPELRPAHAALARLESTSPAEPTIPAAASVPAVNP